MAQGAAAPGKGKDMIRTVTGSTTDQPVQDATFRGALAALLVGIVGVLDERLNLTPEETQLAMTAATFLAFFLGGLFDRFVKSRL